MYKGIIIEESLEDPLMINKYNVNKVEVEKVNDELWHKYWVEVEKYEIDSLKEQIKPSWYAHFWEGNEMKVVFKEKIFTISLNHNITRQPMIEYGKSVGVPEHQLDMGPEE